jgi:dCTP deaminase
VIKSDRWIIRMAKETGMIDPFEPRQIKEIRTPSGMKPVISYGVSSYGYDIRVDNVFRVLDPATQHGGINDPKDFDFTGFKEFKGDVCLIPAHGMAIVQSLEHFKIPRNILVICEGKSTYSRCGVHVSISPLEPEWEGRLTFAVHNSAGRPVRVYANEGIAQILFLESDEECQVSYADKKGKYQQQTVLTPPKV